MESFRNENGRYPHINEFVVAKGSPYGKNILSKTFGGIKGIFKAAGIPYKDNDSLIKKINAFIGNFQLKEERLPGAKEFNVSKGSPCSFKVITNIFGTLTNCFSTLGFKNHIRTNKCVIDDEKMLNYINEFNSKYGVNPGVNDFERKLGCPYNKNSIYKHYKSIEKLYATFNLASKPLSKLDNISDEKILNDLFDAIYEYKTTDREVLKQNSDFVYDRSVYEKRFKSWSNALRCAGFNDYNRVLLRYFPEDYRGQNPKEFLKKKIGENGDFTDKQKYLIEHRNVSNTTIMKYFKYINLFRISCDEDIKGIAKMKGKQVANDGHICDSESEKKVDNFLYLKGFKHDIHVKYPNSSKVCDFVVYFSDKMIYIECAAFYGSSSKYDNNIKQKIKDAKSKYELYVFYDSREYSLKALEDYLNEQ